MSNYPSKRFLASIFAVTFLASGGAIFWSTWNPNARSLQAVAQAAPKPKSPIVIPRAPAKAPQVKPASKAERAAAQTVISAQLRAFNEGNWKEAAKYQSAGLKQNFPSPEAFGQMIQKTYPAFVNAKKVTFGPAYSLAGHIQIEVNLTRYDGQVTKALYSLAKEKAGYRIESVFGGQTIPKENATIA